jgi:hypothetical protein
MGFFKNIGKTIKKASKQISFKNAVKLAGSAVSSLPGIGGIAGSAILSAQDAHYAKKAQAQADNEAQAQAANEAYNNAQTNLNDSVNTIGQSIGGQAITNAWYGVNQGVKTGASNVGADVMQGSIMAWLKKRWYMVAGLLVAIFVVIKLASPKTSSYRRR